MGSRGQKRSELGDEFPADKRACSSLESRPSSSNSPPQTTVIPPKTENHERDMETSSSSASASGRSEGDLERDHSPYGSCDSDDYNDSDIMHRTLARFQRQRSYGDQGKIKRVISTLTDETDPSGQLVSLTELCEVLSFSTEDSMSGVLADQLAPVLVKFANHESNPDIMLLSIRAIAYLCDVYPRASAFLVRHDTVPALCQRLAVIEYLDVAEQCLQALEKISRDQPLACLQSGAIMAVLGFIDFFSTSIQRTALSTVVNICKKLPSECPVPFMEAVPTLCGLLNYEDKQLVESVVTCLVKIADRVKDSRDKLDELCKHGLVEQTMHLIGSNSRMTLSQTTFTSLIGLLAKLAAGSSNGVRTIFEHDVGSIARNVLSNYELSHGIEKNNNQVHEILRLLSELLPPVVRHQESQPLSLNEKILADHSDELGKFGTNLLPILIQVVNSGANLYVCHGCLSVINKLVYQIRADVLFEVVENTNMPSFLMGVFTRKDYHILTLALQITELLLEKLSDTLMPSFAKEGVLFAIDALLTPEKCSAFMFPSTSEMLPPDFSLKNCLCYTYGNGDCVSTSEPKACKLEKDCVQEVAKRIREKYFAADLHSFESVVTDVLQNLRKSASELTGLVSTMHNDGCTQHEGKLCCLLNQVMLQIGADEPISTFELLESGIIKALVNFLFGGLYEKEKVELSEVSTNFDLVLKRFEAFARSSFSSSDPSLKEVPFSLLVRKLQIALSTAERFPVILGNLAKLRGSYASVPFGRPTAHPCLRVRLKREEDEKDLVDYSEDVVTIDPFCSVSAIKSYLWPRVAKKGSDISKRSEGSDLPESVLQDERDKTAAASLASMDIDVSKSMAEPLAVLPGTELHPVDGDVENEIIRKEASFHYPSNGESTKSDASSEFGSVCSRLAIFLEGIELDDSSTLYQSVLQQRMKSQDEICSVAKVWIEVYTLTYKKADTASNESLHPTLPSNEAGLCQQHLPFSSNVVIPESLSGLDTSSPANDIIFLLRNLEIINRYGSHLVHHETVNMFAMGKGDDLGLSKLLVPKLSSNDFVNSKLSQKLEQQMRDPLTVSVGAMPLWCKSLISTCPFLFTFEAKCKFFQLSTFGRSYNESQSPHGDSPRRGSLLRKKFLASRECILDSAARMMDKHAGQKVILEVEYNEEVGTGLGPTLEFYTLVCQEFQKAGLDMWRGDYCSKSKMDLSCGVIASSMGLFPRPWSERTVTSNGSDFPDVMKRFSLLGWIVAKGLQDKRVLDIPFSKAFYKLILGQDLTLYDIQSFDPEFGRTLLEFHAIVGRQKFLESACEGDLASELDLNFRGMKIEALCLDFALPGYPDYVFPVNKDHSEVTIDNLEDYVTLVVDATLNAGIRRQVEAFKSGFNKVFPINHLQIFTEEELEHLLCGEHDSWVSTELLDHIKLDHGYTASSHQIVFLVEILGELNYDQRRAFLQFVTGAPRLPPGGLGSLNPKLTIVRKHSSNSPDLDLPSVMTCTNYLKLPPYSSKELMKEKLICAITEGQGSFHLS